MKNIVFKISSHFKFQYMINWSLLILISLLMINFSCSKNDDQETIDNETPINNETHIDNETPIDNDSSIDNVPTNNNPSLIVYTDIEPDFVSDDLNTNFGLDLNNDGIVDFTLKSLNENWAFWVEPNLNTNNVNALAAVAGPFESYIIPLDKNSIISSLAVSYFYDWYGGFIVMELCDTFPPYCYYSWQERTDKYLGLRFQINEETHYGWARLDVSSPTKWIIKDYAYNATPNMPILAGQNE